jgi:hypothetical protein
LYISEWEGRWMGVGDRGIYHKKGEGERERGRERGRQSTKERERKRKKVTPKQSGAQQRG